MSGVIDFYFLNGRILSSDMKQLSQHINYNNHNIHYFDQTSKVIVDLNN